MGDFEGKGPVAAQRSNATSGSARKPSNPLMCIVCVCVSLSLALTPALHDLAALDGACQVRLRHNYNFTTSVIVLLPDSVDPSSAHLMSAPAVVAPVGGVATAGSRPASSAAACSFVWATCGSFGLQHCNWDLLLAARIAVQVRGSVRRRYPAEFVEKDWLHSERK